jgi:hypothetical protein
MLRIPHCLYGLCSTASFKFASNSAASPRWNRSAASPFLVLLTNEVRLHLQVLAMANASALRIHFIANQHLTAQLAGTTGETAHHRHWVASHARTLAGLDDAF